MAKLGPRGLALVLDILDAMALGSSGIHIVVSDRAELLADEFRARSAAPVVPLVNPQGDALATELRERSGEPTLALGVVAAGQASALEVLHLLNDQRESLVRRGLCVVVIVAGDDARAADAAYLELQAHAPDFWSVRSHVHRLVGADPEEDARARMLELMAPPGGDVGSAVQWMATREPIDEWVEHRLWRTGPRREAWLSSARRALDSAQPEPRFFLDDGVELDRGATLDVTPLGDAIPAYRWPRPQWPSGQLDEGQQVLVRALGHALDRDGWAELAILHEDQHVRPLVEVVLTVGLLREASRPLILHIDASGGLSEALARCLADAGVLDVPDGLIARARRLRGATSFDDVLLLVTEASASEFLLLRASIPTMTVVGLVRGQARVTFAILATPAEWQRARRAQRLLHMWLGGAVVQWLRVETAETDLRAALSVGEHVIVLADPSMVSQARIAVGAASQRLFELPSSPPDEDEAMLASAQLLAGDPFASNGRSLGELAEVFQAVRALVAVEDDHVLTMARMLDEQSMLLQKQGLRVASTLLSGESVALYREIARAHPQPFLTEMVLSLHSLANHLLWLGRPAEARRAAEEAVAYLRELAREHRVLTPNLAHSLNGLGISSSLVEAFEAGLGALSEAVEIWRTFEWPRFRLELAKSLNSLGVPLGWMGRHEDGLRASEESVAIWRDVVIEHPEHRPNLARSLSNLAIRWNETERPDIALPVLDEAIAIWRSVTNPTDDEIADMVRSLAVRAHILQTRGDDDSALASYVEGVRRIVTVFETQPLTFVKLVVPLVRPLRHISDALGRPFPADLAAHPRIARILASIERETPDP